MTLIAVIGAGAGGLCAAKHLRVDGHDVTVFEMGSRVGGLWVYDNDNGRSPAYSSLHINSEQAVTSFEDFPFPAGTRLYPHHSAVAAYLEAYADHFGLRSRIQLNCEVAAVEKTADGGWLVRLSTGEETVFDAVVIAPGHQAVPSHPPYRDRFAGEYLHVHDYRVPAPFAGKQVLIVGVGNSALDVAADICTLTSSTVLAARSPVLIMPRVMFGVPASRILAKVERPWLPWCLRRGVRNMLAMVAHGRMERWGLVTPKTRTHPASHPSVMTHAAYGRIEFRSAIVSVDDDRVRFADGREERYDVMIAATGYELELPFLDEKIISVKDRRLDLYKRVFHPEHPGLYFVGYFNVAGGANIRMMDTQARLVTAVASGRLALPSRRTMHDDIERERTILKQLYPDRPRYGMELDPKTYRKEVDQLLQKAHKPANTPPLEVDSKPWSRRTQ
jgi:cation diffusion facilitator CzcD-associated flavoprotein CzcO